MPIYEYTCESCGTQQDQFNRIADRHTNAPLCCETAMAIRPQAGLVYIAQKDMAVQSPIDGTVLTTHRQRRDYMARNNLIDANDFPPKEVIARSKKKIAERKALAAQLPQPEAVKKELFATP